MKTGKKLTEKQREEIKRNYNAFVANFGPVDIERQIPGKGFFIYYPATDETYTHYAPSLAYVDGWLYGAVQAVNVIEPAKKYYNISAEMDGDDF